jgi:ABC-2 type transport system permease protein
VLLRNPFTKWLYDSRRSLLGWTVAIVAVGLMYAAFWPTVQTPEMARALEAYPEGLLEAFNYSDVTTAAGYLGSSVYGLLIPLLLVVFAIAAGARAVAGDEDAGTLDLVLAHPVGRTRLALQRFAGLALQVAVVVILLGLAMIGLSTAVEFAGVGPAEFLAISLHLALFGIAFGALAYAIGAATGRKAAALAGSAGVAVLGYLANAVFPQVEGLAWARNLSPFHWYLGGSPLVNGVQVSGVLLLLGFAVLLVALGTWAFGRRDIAV